MGCLAMDAKPRIIRKAVCTWVPKPDYERFRAIAKSNGVTAAEYLRSMIVDVLAEESVKVPLSVESLTPLATVPCQS